MARIYVASSWRNQYYPEVVSALRSAGHEVYDFRNPPHGGSGFRWTDIDPDARSGRSAHTEAGWMAGSGKKVIVYIPEMVEPELMYKLFHAVVGNLDDLIHNL